MTLSTQSVEGEQWPFVSPAWLARRIDDPDLRILDATVLLSPPSPDNPSWTVANARAAHDLGHIPGAQIADLVEDFSDPDGRFPRPSPARLSAALSRLGVAPGSTIVIYDRAGMIWAARVSWVLRSFGVSSFVLDGGFAGWEAGGFDVVGEPTRLPPAPVWPLDDRTELFVGRDEVLGLVEGGGGCLVNALDRSDFTARQTRSYARPGRIPGSANVPATALLDDAGQLLPRAALRSLFDAQLASTDRQVVYCGGGIAACLDALVLAGLGVHDVAVYDASYEEWAADDRLPVEVEPPAHS